MSERRVTNLLLAGIMLLLLMLYLRPDTAAALSPNFDCHSRTDMSVVVRDGPPGQPGNPTKYGVYWECR